MLYYTLVEFRDRDQDLITVGNWPATISKIQNCSKLIQQNQSKTNSNLYRTLKKLQNRFKTFRSCSETVSIPDSN